MARIYKVFGGTSIALLAALWLSISPVKADDSLYTVEGVKVDITAESAIAAREQAFAKAEQDAFTILAQRMLTEAEAAAFTPPDADTISAMVMDFELTDERLSPVRYIGTYTFRFRDDDVKSFFGSRGATYTDVVSRPVLVLPFYQWGSRMVLWEGDNPWLSAWNRAQQQRGLVRVTVPIGDAQDIIDIADDQALSYDPGALDSMLLRYDVGGALIAIATPEWGDEEQNVAPGAMPRALSVMLYRTTLSGPEFITTVKAVPADGDTLETMYDRAATMVRDSLQKDWKERTAVSHAPQAQASATTLQARVRIAAMREWVEMQKALSRVQGVQNIRVIKLSPQEARIELAFQGTESRLRLALEQANIVLSQPQVSFTNYAPGTDPMAMPGSPLVYDLYLNKPRMATP